jgi:hypothetical protein
VPLAPRVTNAAISLSESTAFATATPHSQYSSSEWSFLAVTDSNDFVSRHSESAHCDVNSGRFVDSRGQRHDCTAIEDHMDLESKLADYF